MSQPQDLTPTVLEGDHYDRVTSQLQRIDDLHQRRESAGDLLTEAVNQMSFLTMGVVNRMIWAGGFLTIIRGTFPKRAKEGEESWADYLVSKGLNQQTVNNYMRMYEHRSVIDPTQKVRDILSQISTRVRQQLPPKGGDTSTQPDETHTEDHNGSDETQRLDINNMVDQYGRTPTEGDKNKAHKYANDAVKYGGSLTYEQALKIILMNKRPPTTTPRKPKPTGVFVPLPITEEQRVLRLAKRQGMDPQVLIREAVKQYLKTPPPTPQKANRPKPKRR